MNQDPRKPAAQRGDTDAPALGPPGEAPRRAPVDSRRSDALATALRESEERFRKVFESAPTGIAITDWEGRFEQCNPAYAALVGRTEEELRRLTFASLVHPDDLERNLAELRRLQAGEATSFEIENRYVRKDGRTVWVHKLVSVLPGERGAPAHVIALVTDITARKEAERALRESESFYRQTLESIPGMTFTNKPDGTCDYVSEQWVEFTGVPASEQLGDGWSRILHPDDRARATAAWRAAVEGHGGYDLEYRVRHRDGEYAWFKVRGRAIRDASGAIVRWFGTAVNVDSLKRTEAALRESEERFRTLADNISQLAWMADASGWLFWYNERWYEYTGTTFEEMQGWGWKAVHHPDHLERVLVRYQRSLDTGEPWEDVFPLRGKDGRYRWFLSRALPIRDAGGKVVRWFGTNTDVTEQRAAEEALRDAGRRKDEFLATLAHELRNPLAPLRNGLYVLAHTGGQGAAAGRALAMMERQLGQMVRLIDDLLDLSRLSRGKIALQKERVSLAAVAHQAVETSRPAIDEGAHVLEIDAPPEPIHVDADPTRLAQAISNLLHNAAKFTPRGGHIRLSVERRGGEAVASVRDDGIGIPPDMLGRVFDMFTQVDPSLERSRGGLGIGLSLVRQLVELHGGRVEARSAGPGRGSEMIIHLPLAAPAPAERPAGGAAAAGSGGRRILVVDDNRDAAQSLAMMLDLRGHETRLAHDGLEALDMASAFLPDVVLLDIGMPRMNGYDAARELRRRMGRRVRLVALTGWGQEEDRRRSKEAGFDLHLVKPVEPGALMDLLASSVLDTA